MRGLKFLFKSWVRWKWTVVIAAAMFAGAVVISCVFKSEFGDEDYLMSAAFLQMASYCVLMVAAMVVFMNINGFKLIRSSPIAKELYTKSVPIFIIGLSAGCAVLANGIYFIVLAAQGAGAEYFSDTLVFMAMGVGSNILCFSLLSRTMFGGIFGLYLNMFPYIAVILALSERTKHDGFGLPVWASALIFLGAVAVSSIASFIICGAFFKRLNFKMPATAYTGK